jgi:hypothetical protein
MPQKYDRAFFLLLDGARTDVFRELLAKGDLPNVSRYFIEPGSHGEATSVFPTVTAVAYVPFLTGRFPGPANIPGIRWFDPSCYGRKRLSAYRFRDYTGLGSYLIDRDLAPHAKTLFELCGDTSSIFSGVARGTGIRRDAAYFLRIPYALYWQRTGNWDPIDRRGRAYLRKAISRTKERFTFHGTLSVDEYSHKEGPRAPRVMDAYRGFDSVVGELCEGLAEVGQLERSLLILSADHGHTEVTRHLDFEGFFEKRGLRTLYFPYGPRGFFDCDVACMVGGNGMAHVYLRGEKGWAERPPTEDLLARHPTLIDDLLGQDEIELVAHRTETPDGPAVRVRTGKGQALVCARGGEVLYDTTGGDPFGYAPLPARMSRAELLERTASSEYPDAPLQLAQLFDSPRSGDLIVSAAPGCDLRQRFERWEHRSSHGSLRREHIQVPLCSSARLAKGPWRTTDVFATILSGLGETVPYCDGRDLLAPSHQLVSTPSGALA